MDEMDLPQMKKEVESLKYQLAFKREKSSKTVTEYVHHLLTNILWKRDVVEETGDWTMHVSITIQS